MKRKINAAFAAVMATLAVTLLPSLAMAQEAASEAAGKSIDAQINDFVAPIAKAVVDVIFFSVPIGGVPIPLIVVWLILAAVIFTLYFGFIQVFAFRHAIDIVRGKYTNPNDPGQISHFQALSTALLAL